MAIVYPEDRVDNGTVVDPRPVNRVLGRYCAEMGGLLDRDNFEIRAFSATKMASMTGTSAPTSTSLDSPFNCIDVWRSAATQTLSSESVGRIQIDNVGGNITTQDSALLLDFSAYIRWDTPALTWYYGDVMEVSVSVDGITVDQTGPMAIHWRQISVQVHGYVPVGAGIHNVRAWVRIYSRYDSSFLASLTGSTTTLYIEERELIVREARR